MNVTEVELGDFYIVTDFGSQQTLSKIQPRPYLSDMVFVRFKRGEGHFGYKTSIQGNFDGKIL